MATKEALVWEAEANTREASKVEFLLQARQRNRAVALQALIRWSRIGTTGMICGKE